MSVKTSTIDYTDGGQSTFQGFLARDSSKLGQSPAVLIIHQWSGRSDFEDQRAVELAKMGYVAFAVDLYGKGVRGSGPEENQKLIAPLLADRPGILLQRLKLSMQTLQKQEGVDARKIGAIGYCFGGLCVLDMARNCFPDLLGVASLHGLFSQPPYSCDKDIKSKVLVLHGWADPMVPPNTVVSLGEELTARKADWQLHAYGDAKHAFSMPSANRPEMGAVYSKSADARSWAAVEYFLKELFVQ